LSYNTLILFALLLRSIREKKRCTEGNKHIFYSDTQQMNRAVMIFLQGFIAVFYIYIQFPLTTFAITIYTKIRITQKWHVIGERTNDIAFISTMLLTPLL